MNARPALRLLAACGFALAGCSSPAPPPPAPAVTAAPPPPETNSGLPKVEVAYRIAAPDTVLTPMPTGVVLLTKGNDARNIAFCHAFFKVYTSAAAVMKTNPGANVFQTFWPELPDKEVPKEIAADNLETGCKAMIDHYDYDKARRYLRAIARYLHKPAHPGAEPVGPVLLAMTGPDPAVRNVVLDASPLPFDPARPDDTQFGGLTTAWNDAASQATQNAGSVAGRPPAPKRKLAVAGKPATPPRPACPASVQRVKIKDVMVEVKVQPDTCSDQPTAPAPHDILAAVQHYTDPDNPAVAFGCKLIDTLKDEPAIKIVTAFVPGLVSMGGDLVKEAVCDGLISKTAALFESP